MAVIAKKIQDTKVKAINELKEDFGGITDFIFTNYRGLTVEQISLLRKQLRAKGAKFKVIKNNFARIAFNEISAPDVSAYLTGPTAIAISPKDSNEVAKLLFDFARENHALNIKGALVGSDIYDAAQAEVFSKLPGKLELISMLMSVINGPVRGIAAALNDIPSRLVRTIKAVADKKEGAA